MAPSHEGSETHEDSASGRSRGCSMTTSLLRFVAISWAYDNGTLVATCKQSNPPALTLASLCKSVRPKA